MMGVMQAMNSVSLVHVSKSFGRTAVLQDLSISFTSGQIHGIVGRNGSGKTVLFKLITGLIAADSGMIEVEGTYITPRHPRVPGGIGAIVESPGFLPHYSGYRNLALLATIRRTLTSEQIQAAMRIVGLDPTLRRHVRAYSMGMRQRLGIAQAIMERPSLLILDEPMNGLDNTGVRDMRELFLNLNAQGMTILLASHNREDIEVLCNHVYQMDAGQIAQVR